MIQNDILKMLSEKVVFIQLCRETVPDAERSLKLLYLGVRIKGFLSDEENAGTRILNIPVWMGSRVEKKMSSDEVFFILRFSDKETRVIDDRTININKFDMVDVDCPFSINAIGRILEDNRERKLCFYRPDIKAKTLIRMLKLMDVKVDGILVADDADVSVEGIPTRSIFSIYNEDLEKIKVYISDPEDAGILEKAGLRYGIEFAECSKDYRLINHPLCFDGILGYNFSEYPEEENLQGFVRLGDRNAKKRIVILGNSTSDVLIDKYYAWPRSLSNMIEGYGVQLLCGAVRGHNSTQNLNKLLRDVLNLEPNMIIHVCGITDAYQVQGREEYHDYPYYDYYQIELIKAMETVKPQIESSLSLSRGGCVLGVRGNADRYSLFKRNIEIMHLICGAYNILYQCYLQPSLVSKKNTWDIGERELFNHISMSRYYEKYWVEFYEKYKRNPVSAEYMTDLTGFFDGFHNVFLDDCHLNRSGNEMLAQFFEKTIRKALDSNAL